MADTAMPRDLSKGSSLGPYQGEPSAIVGQMHNMSPDERAAMLYGLGGLPTAAARELSQDPGRYGPLVESWAPTTQRQAWTWVGQVLDEAPGTPAAPGPEPLMETYDPGWAGLPTVGSSDVAVILGIAPWRDSSRIHTWAELAGLIPYRARESTGAMKIGTQLEQTVLRMYAGQSGNYVEGNATPYRAAYPWMHATPDGSAVTPDDVEFASKQWGPDWDVSNILDPINLEAKVVVRGGVWYPREPSYYTVQCMWHNVCAARSVTHLPALFLGPYEFRVFVVAREHYMERLLIEQVWAWYHRHVIGGEVPEPDDSVIAAQTLAKVHRNLAGEDSIQADQSDLAMVTQIRHIREEVAKLESERKRLTNMLRAKTQAANAKKLVHPATDRTLASWTRTGAFTVSKK